MTYRKLMQKRWEELCKKLGPAWKAANPFDTWLMLAEDEEAKERES